jgi:hypothetical protein
MTEKEYSIIQSALNSSCSADQFSLVCRQVILQRLKWDNQPDRNLRFLLEDVVNTLCFPLSCQPDDDKQHIKYAKEVNYEKAIIGGSLIGIGLLSSIFSKRLLFRFLGGISSVLGGYELKNSISKVSINKSAYCKISKEEVGAQIDSVYESLSKFYQYRQLEGRNIKILRWFQNMYADDKIGDLRGSISKLLGQFGYRFVEYAPEISADFELSSGNVENPITTEPAIFNENGVVCKGTVVLPNL